MFLQLGCQCAVCHSAVVKESKHLMVLKGDRAPLAYWPLNFFSRGLASTLLFILRNLVDPNTVVQYRGMLQFLSDVNNLRNLAAKGSFSVGVGVFFRTQDVVITLKPTLFARLTQYVFNGTQVLKVLSAVFESISGQTDLTLRAFIVRYIKQKQALCSDLTSNCYFLQRSLKV